MATWGDLKSSDPAMSEAGRAILYQVGVGLAFLGTVRKDGVARLHPVCPLITDDHMFLFVIPSPSATTCCGRAVIRRTRFRDTNEDAFGITGSAVSSRG
jgi:hypothetical protein